MKKDSQLIAITTDHFSMMCPPFATAVGAVVVETVKQAIFEV
jgi:hypothetical protein